MASIYIYYMQWLITKLSLNLLVLHTGAVQVRPDLRLYICWERVGSRWLSLWLPCTILLKIPETPERSNGGVRLKYVRISLHLVGFSCRWFCWDQSWMWSAVCCSELCLEAGTTSETVVSSANFHMWNPSSRRRSFIIGRNSYGPKWVPWGTPAGTSNQSDNIPFSFTLCCLLLRKSITQFTTVGFTPRLESFSKV